MLGYCLVYAAYVNISVITPGSVRGPCLITKVLTQISCCTVQYLLYYLSCCIITLLILGGCDLCNCQLSVYNEAPREQALCLQLQELNRNHYVC